MPFKPRVLLVEDDTNYQEIYIRCLGAAYEIKPARTLGKAFSLLESENFDVVLVDLKMLGDKHGHFSGFDILERVKSLDSELQVIVITGYGSSDLAWRAMKNGAFDYITKGKDLRAKLPLTVQSALDVRSLKRELLNTREMSDIRPESDRIIGNSSSMQEVFERIYSISNETMNTIIEGEKGTGKRLIAQTIHLRSRLRHHPLIVIDCSRLTEFTLNDGILSYQYGKEQSQLEVMQGIYRGTVFLADICDMQLQFQQLLLDLLIGEGIDEKRKELKNTQNDVLFISSTHQNLKAMVERGKFSKDLFATIYQKEILVPPLRDRKDGDDILTLAAMFLQRYASGSGIIFSSDAIRLMEHYDYPGNVEELENIIAYVMRMKSGNLVKPEHFPPSVRNFTKPKRQRYKQISAKQQIETEHILEQDEVSTDKLDLLNLHQLMDRSFNQEELRTLCFGINVDYDNLQALGKDGKIRELIAYFLRRQELHLLLDICNDMRPNILWPTIY